MNSWTVPIRLLVGIGELLKVGIQPFHMKPTQPELLEAPARSCLPVAGGAEAEVKRFSLL